MRTIAVPNEVLLPEVVEMLFQGNLVTLKAKGNSMLPFIVGSRDSVMLQKNKEMRIGHIVLAEIAPQHFVLHRIIRIDNNRITLMGDGNLAGTETCAAENIFGRAVAIIRNGKQVDCYSHVEQFKARIWKALLPFRRYLLAVYRRTLL